MEHQSLKIDARGAPIARLICYRFGAALMATHAGNATALPVNLHRRQFRRVRKPHRTRGRRLGFRSGPE